MGRSKPKRSAPPAWMVTGAIVDYHSVIGRDVTQPGMEVAAAPYEMNPGQWVVKLKGKAGVVAIEACSPPAYDVEADRAVMAAVRGEDGAEWEDVGLGLSEPYDYGLATRSVSNGTMVYDVTTEPIEGAPMYERCTMEQAQFVISAWKRWPAALREIERLRAELAELRRG